MRELLLMTEGKEKAEWARAASIMAVVANSSRTSKSQKTFKPGDFNPYVKKEELTRRRRVKAPLTVLRDLWCKEK